MQPFDLIIFDCDGVLIDSEILAMHVVADTLRDFGFPVDADDIAARYTGRSSPFMHADLEKRFGKPVTAEIKQAMDERKREVFTRDLKALPGIVALLENIAHKVCVGSSSSPERLQFTLSLVGLYDRFHPYIFSAAQVKNGKPAPDLFLFAAQQMDTLPARCLVIEDSRFGVEAAAAAGMTAWGFVGGGHCGPDHRDELMKAGAEQVFDRMQEIEAALSAA